LGAGIGYGGGGRICPLFGLEVSGPT